MSDGPLDELLYRQRLAWLNSRIVELEAIASNLTTENLRLEADNRRLRDLIARQREDHDHWASLLDHEDT